MARSFIMILVIIMLGMIIGVTYFSSTRAEAATETPDKKAILNEAGKYLGASCDAAAAYAFLKTRANGAVLLEPKLTDGNFAKGGIEPELACRMERFLRVRPDIRINSGYRSIEKQRSTCRQICGRDSCPGKCASPGNSCHQYGLAVDISKNDKATRAQARLFNLHFPYSGPHIQCFEQKVAACGRSRKSCSPNGLKIDPGGDTGRYEELWQDDSWQGHKSLEEIEQELQQELSVPDAAQAGGGDPNTDVYDPAYNPNLEELEGVSTSTESDLLAFEEFPLGEEGEEFLTENEEQDTVESSDPDATSSPEAIGDDGSTRVSKNTVCTSGVTTQNIYGHIICARDGAESSNQIDESTVVEEGAPSVLFDSTSEEVSKNRIMSFVNQVLPIRHLGNQSEGGIFGGGTSNRVPIYDAFQPFESTAYDRQRRGAVLREGDIRDWILEDDIALDDTDVPPSLSLLGGAVPPVALHLLLVTFGPGSHAVGALVNVADTL